MRRVWRSARARVVRFPLNSPWMSSICCCNTRAGCRKALRLTVINVSATFSTFFSDQLKVEQANEAKVDAGDITSEEADERNEEWERREWDLRTAALPKKIGWAVVRFHACTALMRCYESVLARYVLSEMPLRPSLPLLTRPPDRSVLQADGGSVGTPAPPKGNDAFADIMGVETKSSAVARERGAILLDKLTRDTFRASRSTSRLLRDRECSPGTVVASDGIETSTSREFAKIMFSTCLWANVIPFFAELTVQQVVLVYDYAKNYTAREERSRKRRALQQEKDDAIRDSAYILSLMIRSSHLTIARSMSWIAASAGGAVGSVMYPGWGTVFGVQIGDAFVGALLD